MLETFFTLVVSYYNAHHIMFPSMARANTIVEKDKTKTEASYRTFPLSDDIVNLLVLLKNQEKEKNHFLVGNIYKTIMFLNGIMGNRITLIT